MRALSLSFLFILLFSSKGNCQIVREESSPEKPIFIESVKKNYISTNALFLIGRSEPNISYERFINDHLSLSLYAGYKFKNFLTGLLYGGGGPEVFFFSGPRGSLTFRCTLGKYFFTGIKVGYSALQINDATIYTSASSYAGYYSGFTSKRTDLDLAATIGFHLINIKYKWGLDIFINGGIRNAYGKTTYKYIKPLPFNVGGAVPYDSNPVLNGRITAPLFEIGVSIGPRF